MNIIHAEQVSKGFGGVFQLGPLSLRVAAGEILGVVGPEGSGKTTLLKLLWGFIRPDSGYVCVCGMQPHLNQLQLRRRVGYLGCNPRIHSEYTAQQFMQQVGIFYDGWNKACAIRLLTHFDIDPRARMADLSNTDRKKVAIASVLTHQPNGLILDEPISGIDRAGRLAILRFLKRLAKEELVSILVSCPIPEDLDYIADSILMLKDGRAVHYASVLQQS
jgi:ABC-2 type transport system ATP-binding protein